VTDYQLIHLRLLLATVNSMVCPTEQRNDAKQELLLWAATAVPRLYALEARIACEEQMRRDRSVIEGVAASQRRAHEQLYGPPCTREDVGDECRCRACHERTVESAIANMEARQEGGL
jgi:hypothetical protein